MVNVQTADNPHCVVTALKGGERSVDVGPRCYPTFAEAVADATAGAVELEPGATTLRRADLPDRAERISTVLGIEYDKPSFGGWSYVIQGADDAGCHSGAKFRVPNLPQGRNNAISSARSYSGCKSRHFNGPNLTGDSYLCGCALMGAMDNLTSSIRFAASGARRP